MRHTVFSWQNERHGKSVNMIKAEKVFSLIMSPCSGLGCLFCSFGPSNPPHFNSHPSKGIDHLIGTFAIGDDHLHLTGRADMPAGLHGSSGGQLAV
jgi:hypothetical protein